MENKKQPIHPIQTRDNSQIIGLTKREYFAGLAMQGLLANSQTSLYKIGYSPENVSRASIQMADELLKQLDNGK